MMLPQFLPKRTTLSARLSAFVVAALMLEATRASAADFVATSDHGLPLYATGAPACGDVDNDGDLDVVFSHFGAERHTWVYLNDGAGRFANSGQELEPLNTTSAALGDYDGDGWLDLALTGLTPAGRPLTRLYRNNRNGTFTLASTLWIQVRSAALAWVDIDGDGDLDFIVSGAGETGVQAAAYRNDGGGAFTEISNTGLGPVGDGAIAAADYDGDADMDLWLAGGDANGSATSTLGVNRGDGTFEARYSGFRVLWSPSVAWGDANNDGWPDLIQTGTSPIGVSAEILRNNGSGGFVTLADLSPTAGLDRGNAAWGDYDNDGRIDLVLAGFNGAGTGFARVLRNISAGPFFTNQAGALPFVGVGQTYVQWGDFNGDAKLDVLLCGHSDEVRLLRNNRTTTNTPPTAPTNLSAVFTNDVLTFRWTRATDAQTPTPGLNYNLRVGTTPGAGNIVPPHAHAVTGRRRLATRGNAGSTNFWRLHGLPSGTYYWSVQAIDSAFAGSAFAAERAVVVNRPPSITAPSDTISPPNAVIGPLPVTITDPDSPVSSVVVNATSSNPLLFPAAGIVLGGNAGNRTVTLTPAPNRVGSAVITLTATDSSGNAATSAFNITVPNTPPSISTISNRTILITRPAPLIHFTVGDAETSASNLAITAHSVIQEVIPDSNILLGGSGSNRTVQITPAPGALGGTTIWIDVRDSDGGINRAEFVVNVADLIEVTTGLPGVDGRSFAWGDFDNDGFPDIALGEPDGAGNATGRIYRNTGGSGFVRIEPPLTSLVGSSLAWGDMDRDGDLDLAWNGRTTNGTQTCFLYRNDGVAGFNAVTNLPGGEFGFVTWADADNDGDADLLVNGSYGTWLHLNDGSGGWVTTTPGFPAMIYSAAAWGDYDNDGDLDVIAGGQEPRTFSLDNPTGALRYRADLYRNDSGRWTLAVGFPGTAGGTLSWGDRDMDGDLDLLITGISQDATTRLYENRGTAGFLDTASPLRWAPGGYAAWGDFENDGDLDLLYGGYALFGLFSAVMINEPGTFYESRRVTSFYAATFGAWADYDNDADLDAMVMDSGAAVLFRNETVAPNTPPPAPSGLHSTTGPRSVHLAWDAPTDANQAGGLTYNLRVGRTPGGQEVLPPMSDPLTGRRRIPASGNAGEARFWKLTHLPFGTYHWSVQAVDNSFAGSAFATEGTFTITNTFPVITSLGGTVVRMPTLETSAPIPFTIRDGETDPTNLVLTAFSSNPALVPAANVVFGGDGDARTVTVTPDGLRPGTATITIVVTDADGATARTDFAVEVTSRAPVFSAIERQVMPVNGSLTVPFSVWDFETPASQLALTGNSSDPSLVPAAGLVFGGAGLNRTITVTPQRDRTGSVEVTLSAGDSDGTNSTIAFVVTITNTPPTLSSFSNQVLYPGTSTPEIAFTIGDAESAAEDLTVSAVRTDSGLPLDIEFALGGTGTSRTLRVRSLQIQRGTFTVSVGVQDPHGGSATRTFSVALGEFTPSASLPYSAAMAWGDSDGDNDLDLLLGGLSPTAAGPRLYRQSSGAFSNANIGLPPLEGVELAWADYDRDGDLDIAITGRTSTNRPCLIYRNQGTNFILAATLQGVSDGAMAWGDYDNDGDLDLAISGQGDKATNITQLIRNLGTAGFETVPAELTPLGLSAVAWGDYDGDGDLDLITAGTDPAGLAVTLLYQNDDGVFTRVGTDLIGVRDGSVAWGDYDLDGDLDVLLTGWSTALSQPVARVYRNQGGGMFTDANAGLTGVQRGNAAWGDYDNDGDPDIVLLGTPASSGYGRIYRNNAGTFEDIGLILPAVAPGNVAWGDADGDGDLDLVLAGTSGASAATLVFHNNLPRPNTSPVPPASLAVTPGWPNNRVTLQWAAGTDLETSSSGLTYNLRVGTTPGGGDVVGPHSSANGRRWLPAPGPMSARVWQLHDLPRGTFFWSVQSIDATLAGSSFSAESSFTISNAAPRLSSIGAQTTLPDRPLPPVPFLVTDDEDPAESLIITARSSNPALLPGSNILVGGAGTNRTLTLLPLPNASGTTFITITAVDSGGVSAAQSFLVSIEAFSPLPLNLTGIWRGKGGWVDYNADGDLDFLITGTDANGGISPRMFRNNGGGAVTNVQVGFGRALGTTISWADFNRNGDLEVLIGGELYVQNTAASGFALYQTALPGALAGYAFWGDYDNNGAPDVLVSNADQPARIFRNNGGNSFSNTGLALPPLSRGAMWGDYDNDGDLDIAIASSASGTIGRLFRNDGGTSFTAIATNVVAVDAPIAWGDFDGDGDPDLVATGLGRTRIYRNDGNDTFTEIPAELPAVIDGSLAWADYDNDGDMDLLLAGSPGNGGAAVTRVYRNDGGGVFTDARAGLPGVSGGNASWGDFDGDGDLDVLLTGTTNGQNFGAIARVYRNNFDMPNAAPLAPVGLTSTVTGDAATLAWSVEAVPDDHTPGPALTFNLRVGTSRGGVQIVSPDALNVTGARRLAEPGANGQGRRWHLGALPPGTYYWSVQAVDTAFAGSAFSPEQSFTVTNTLPLAIGQSITLLEDTATNVVLQAIDPDRQTLTYRISTPPAHGTLVGTPPVVVYRPATNYFGPDEFTWTVSDGLAAPVPAVVTLSVLPVPDSTGITLAVRARPGGGIGVTLRGEPWTRHRIEISPDLIHWTPAATVDATPDGTMTWEDPEPVAGQRFYRALQD